MKLDHFTLISRKPLKVHNVGSIKPIFLHEIEDITIHVYNNFLSVLMLDINTYYKWMEKEDDYFRYYSQEQKQKVLEVKKQYEELDTKEKLSISFYDLLMYDELLICSFIEAFNFFFEEEVDFVVNGNEITDAQFSFITYNKIDTPQNIKLKNGNEYSAIKTNRELVGIINGSNFKDVVDIILQRNSVQREEEITAEDLTKVKNKNKVMQLMEKMKKGQKQLDKTREKKREEKGMASDTELANIISCVAAKNHNGLNMINIWDMTIYNLYEQFKLIRENNIHDAETLSVFVWGDKSNKFDIDGWFKEKFKVK